ncbi:MAG TPA: YggT family protein [Dehalococcoidia bacterium]|nr:YggT family protein [Dehalococcoidia bacterium]
MRSILEFLALICNILSFAVFMRAIVSWFPISPNNSFVVILFQVTEPILAPLRRVVPLLGFMDITPLVAIVLLQIVATTLTSL